MPESFLSWRPHPWHGVATGPEPPAMVSVFVEITPWDQVKYEVDKHTGYLRVDRPLAFSSLPPTVYGFVPRTLCGDRTGALMRGARGGDSDPLDVCVLSSQPINHPQVFLDARVLGGIPMLDGGEADDKIVAALAGDPLYEGIESAEALPGPVLDRLVHYFSTYKALRHPSSEVQVGDVYAKAHALAVVEAAMADYRDRFGANPPL